MTQRDFFARESEKMKLRIEKGPAHVAVYGGGFEVATWEPAHGWRIRVGKQKVPLEELIRQLNALQATLAKVAFDETR